MALIRTARSCHPQAGIALLAVLWSVVVLSLLALILSNSVQIEVRTAIYQQEAAQAHAMACGAVEAAIFEIAYRAGDNQERSSLFAWRPGQREGTVLFPGGKADLQIVSETGKLDLNKAGLEQLTRLIEARGVESARARELAGAMDHWRKPESSDPESEALENYYRSRKEGDRPRHAAFASVEELLRVRGMTREILYGTVEVTEEGKIKPKYGVAQDLTISGSGPVNVNYASEEVLFSAPGMDLEMARAVVRERNREPFKTVEDVNRRLPLSLADESLPYLTTSEGKTYSIVAVGQVSGSRLRRTVRALVQVASQGTAPYRTVAWYDDYSSD